MRTPEEMQRLRRIKAAVVGWAERRTPRMRGAAEEMEHKKLLQVEHDALVFVNGIAKNESGPEFEELRLSLGLSRRPNVIKP